MISNSHPQQWKGLQPLPRYSVILCQNGNIFPPTLYNLARRSSHCLTDPYQISWKYANRLIIIDEHYWKSLFTIKNGSNIGYTTKQDNGNTLVKTEEHTKLHVSSILNKIVIVFDFLVFFFITSDGVWYVAVRREIGRNLGVFAPHFCQGALSENWHSSASFSTKATSYEKVSRIHRLTDPGRSKLGKN